MTRLHRKCLVASTALHCLLLLILFLGAAFRDSQPKPMDFPLLAVIPSKVVDDALYGGGQILPAPVERPVPQPPRVAEPEPPKTVREPEPEPKKQPEPRTQPKPTRVVTQSPKPAEPKPASVKPKPQIQVATTTKRVPQPKREQPSTGIEPKVADQLRSRFQDTASRLNRELTPRTDISVPGPGGEAFANYSQVIISIYQQNWIKPVGIEQLAIVKASVTIARDGRVLSANITRLSGNRTVDASVDEVLKRVKETPPFPPGAKDETRTFILSFELTPADLTG